MVQAAENIKESTKSALELCEEMQAFFKEGSLLTRACDETGLDYDATRYVLKGATSKVPMMTAVVLPRWVALWRSAEVERKALSNIVKGIADNNGR